MAFNSPMKMFVNIVNKRLFMSRLVNTYIQSSKLSWYSRKVEPSMKTCDIPVFSSILARNVSFSSRTHMCGELSSKIVGQKVQVSGWIQNIRMDKFIILRDRTGLCQIYLSCNDHKDLLDLPLESVLTVEGKVISRPKGQENVSMGESGMVEVELENVVQISQAEDNLPFPQNKHLLPNEELRMRYRYLDLRRKYLQDTLKFRTDFVMGIRQFLVTNGFLDIETPTLFRRTPGGAKEFVVPTRIKDHYYSLVQSPQQFKQLLMVGGLDRYFQIARCYRDEGGKPDRQPEFTQVDIEMSFADREDVLSVTENLLSSVWPGGLTLPLPRMTYEHAMQNYGVDKPDIRYSNTIQKVTNLFQHSGFPILDENLGREDNIAAMVMFDSTNKDNRKILNAVENESRKALKVHIDYFSNSPLKMISPLIVESGKIVKNGLLKKCDPVVKSNLESSLHLQNGIGFLVFGPEDFVMPVLGKQRTLMANHLIPDLNSREQELLWIIDFPLFVQETGVLESAHHPFTAPHHHDQHLLRSEPLKCRSLHYDLVLNGQEIGGGSVRIHNSDDQRFVLSDVLKEDTAELEHLLQALSCGCPPHAGIALGLDRIIAILTKSDSIRDVIAFPKSLQGRDTMSGAPAQITDEQKSMYHIK